MDQRTSESKIIRGCSTYKSVDMKTKVSHTTRMTGKGDGTQRFHPADAEVTILTGKSVCSTVTVDTYCMCASNV